MLNKGVIFDIQKFCVHDGPGIRTTVFLKGCNLRCKWCHNPESLSFHKQLSYNGSKCTLCGECTRVCPKKVHEVSEEVHTVNFDKCEACGICVENCVYDALRIIGREASVEEVVNEVEKDRKFYEESGGGMTLSGGEAGIQYDFAYGLLKEGKKRGINTCLETNGIIIEERMTKLVEVVDLFLLDYKHTDDKLHKEYTGASNVQLFTSLELLNSLKAQVILRCPIIPGVNDIEDHFKNIAELSQKYSCIEYAEIMAYHSIGKDKWAQIGEEYSFPDLESVRKEKVEEWKASIKLLGGNIK